MKQQEKMPLIPILETGSNKLDFSKVEKHLRTEQGMFTEFMKSYDFSSISYRFDEKSDCDKYSLDVMYEKWFGEIRQGCRYELFIGQSGCFYRIVMPKQPKLSLVYDILKFIGEFNKEIEKICKQYVFTPYSVSHWSDGDYFARKEEYEEEKRLCSFVEILNNNEGG